LTGLITGPSRYGSIYRPSRIIIIGLKRYIIAVGLLVEAEKARERAEYE